jgi:hypothetical protein
MEAPSAYVLVSWLNNRAACQCGFHGKRRLFRGSAVLDVMTHCQTTGHTPVGWPHLKQVTYCL